MTWIGGVSHDSVYNELSGLVDNSDESVDSFELAQTERDVFCVSVKVEEKTIILNNLKFWKRLAPSQQGAGSALMSMMKVAGIV